MQWHCHACPRVGATTTSASLSAPDRTVQHTCLCATHLSRLKQQPCCKNLGQSPKTTGQEGCHEAAGGHSVGARVSAGHVRGREHGAAVVARAPWLPGFVVGTPCATTLSSPVNLSKKELRAVDGSDLEAGSTWPCAETDWPAGPTSGPQMELSAALRQHPNSWNLGSEVGVRTLGPRRAPTEASSGPWPLNTHPAPPHPTLQLRTEIRSFPNSDLKSSATQPAMSNS